MKPFHGKRLRNSTCAGQWDESFDIGSDTLTGINDADYKPPFPLSAKLEKLTIKMDRPKLTPEEITKLEEAQKAAADANQPRCRLRPSDVRCGSVEDVAMGIELVCFVPEAELFYSPDGGAGHGWSGVMIFTMPLTKFQTATASALELTMTTIVVFSEGR
jgi:hypothetical protein